MDLTVWMVLYEGQEESYYKWVEYDYQDAERLMKQLQEKYPDRKWSVVEKDVS